MATCKTKMMWDNIKNNNMKCVSERKIVMLLLGSAVTYFNFSAYN
jgi:hypothetical protein